MISLSITTFNRPEMTIESFRKVLNDDRISEILIVDDHSEWHNYIKLQQLCEGKPKIRLIRNKQNIGCYHNKRKAVQESSNDWVILFDSDNKIDSKYIDAFFPWQLNDKTIYAPEFASPHFDYRGFSGQTITRGNVSKFIDQPKFDCLINTCNYLVPRQIYLQTWHDHREPWTADTLFMNYNWLEAGNSIHVVKGMQYEHRIDDFGTQEGSHYQKHVNKTGNIAIEYMNKLRKL